LTPYFLLHTPSDLLLVSLFLTSPYIQEGKPVSHEDFHGLVGRDCLKYSVGKDPIAVSGITGLRHFISQWFPIQGEQEGLGRCEFCTLSVNLHSMIGTHQDSEQDSVLFSSFNLLALGVSSIF
jgi:hypothetical protein